MQTPTVGRIVHFFPGTTDPTLSNPHNNNGATVLPALIMQVFSPTMVNLLVFTMNSDAAMVRRYSIYHKSAVGAGYGDGVVPAYWDWPEIVRAEPLVFRSGGVSTDGNSGDITYKSFSDDNRA